MADLSLWLIPDEAWRHFLARIIVRLSQQYETPRFEPHLTLLGQIAMEHGDAANRTARLASRLRTFQVVLNGLSYRGEFFRALFLEAERTPPLMEAYRTACVIFDRKPEETFLPHISVLYGDLPATTKDALISRLASELKLPLSVRISRLDLMIASSRLPVSSWHCLASYALGGEAA
jgi:2'-5' RNA ligase